MIFIFQKKEGQEGTNRPKPKAGGAVGGLLPPPPGGVKLAPPPSPAAASKIGSGSNMDILGDVSNTSPNLDTKPAATGGGESWGDFTSAPPKPQPAR